MTETRIRTEKPNGEESTKDPIAQLLARRKEHLQGAGLKSAADRPWFSITASATSPMVADVMINGEIGWDVDAGSFARALAAVTADVLNVSVNSIGGDVFDGIAMYNTLRGHGAQINVLVTGVAASIASVIAMAGDTITMGRGAEMMIHDASAMQLGNAADMRQMAELLDKASDNIASFYAERTGTGDVASWRATMMAETWYTADEAVAAGLADAVTPMRAPAGSDLDMAAITLIRPAARVTPAGSPFTGSLSVALRPEKPADDTTDWTGGFEGLGALLAAEYTPPVDPLADHDFGADLRAAMALVVQDIAEPPVPPVDDSLGDKTHTNPAEYRRAIEEMLQ